MSEKVDATSSNDSGSKDANTGGNSPKAVIKNVDMTEEMQQETVDIASAALEKYNIEKDIAANIKKEFDRRYGPTWHVVVGKNFGSYVTHGAHPFLSLSSPAQTMRLAERLMCSTIGGTLPVDLMFRRL